MSAIRRTIESGLWKWSRALGIAVFSLIYLVSHTWAAPFKGSVQGFSTSIPVPGPDGTFSHHAYVVTFRGYTTTGGSIVCQGTQTSSPPVTEPTGACGAEEIELAATGNYSCQFEGAEDVFHATWDGRACVPFPSCFDCLDNICEWKVGCSSTLTETATVTGGTGDLADSSGSWTLSGDSTLIQVEPTEFDGADFFARTLSAEIEGDFELADGSAPQAGANLEVPSPGTNVSGVGLVSGWSCLGGELAVEFSDADGVILTQTVLQGSERVDTEDVCGDINNGFSSTFNWNLLGPGEKTARLIRNGEEVDSSTFMVTAFDIPFLPPAVEGMCTIADFPETGQNATFVWETSQQGLVLESVN